MIEIKNRYTNAVIYRSETATTVREAAEEAVKADASLRDANLTNASLRDANLTNANLTGANLTGADLYGAYLTGADLYGAYLTGANLTGANLRGADLYGAYLTGADLYGAYLTGANLTGANLRGADLTGANLRGADLGGADLTGADLYGADLTGFDVPSIPGIDAAILAAIENGGALEMSDWHTCETTHCRAGWAIHLAGDAGRALEGRFGPSAAGALIYAASGSHPTPDWHATNAEAMADLRERAAIVAAANGGCQVTPISEIRAALAAATPVDTVAEAWLLARAERRLPSNECQAHDDVVNAVRRARERLPLLTWLTELCDRAEKAETHVASAEAHVDFVTAERERFAAQREEWRAMSIAHEARAESAEAKLALLLPSRDEWVRLCGKAEAERDAAIAERDALGESLTTLVYWHDRDGIDESWWTDARELLRAHEKSSGGEHG